MDDFGAPEAVARGERAGRDLQRGADTRRFLGVGELTQICGENEPLSEPGAGPGRQ
jgi:hypothetical protein